MFRAVDGLRVSASEVWEAIVGAQTSAEFVAHGDGDAETQARAYCEEADVRDGICMLGISDEDAATALAWCIRRDVRTATVYWDAQGSTPGWASESDGETVALDGETPDEAAREAAAHWGLPLASVEIDDQGWGRVDDRSQATYLGTRRATD